MVGAAVETSLDTASHATSQSRRRTVLRIRPSSGWRALDLRELWQYRDLIYFLAWRDVKVRYKQTALGVAWAILQPLAAMAVFAIFLGGLVHVPSDGLPYPLFAYVGLLPWTYFANAATGASSSLVANTSLVSKVYFPRLAIPIAAVLAGLVDFGIGFVLTFGLLLIYGVSPSAGLLSLPLFVGLLLLTALAVGVWLSALDVQYRDVRYAIPFLIQVWLFATPVVYPTSVVPSQYRALYGLNPMAGIVEGFRWALVGHTEFPAPLLAVSVLVTAALFLSGLFYFRRMERIFADVI
jgi:lipopolysaccharide transport system permease protein